MLVFNVGKIFSVSVSPDALTEMETSEYVNKTRDCVQCDDF